jgi:hypothetical protein
MNAVQALLRDRHRAQRGSVLSGVLIIVAFLAIISGALVTELSTHFLISRTLVNRVGNQASVNSAMELALDQLQNTPLANGCPGAPPATSVNGRTASVSYLNCWPTVRESPQFSSIASSSPFTIDGTHAVIKSAGLDLDLYLVGDSGGRIYQYAFGSTSPNWSKNLGTRVTGPPLATLDGANQQDLSNFVPIEGGGIPGCTANPCVEFLHQDRNLSVPSGFSVPNIFCGLPASAAVTSRPAAGIAFPQVLYFGDSGGTLYAYTAIESSCRREAMLTTPGNAAIVAGPIVFRSGNGNSDEVYVVVASTGTTVPKLLRYTYQGGTSLTLTGTLPLPYSKPIGVAVEKTSVPARLAITFAGGGVAIAVINSSLQPSLLVSRAGLGAPEIAAAPFWCSCSGGPQIGVTGVNGTLYVVDTNLNTVASYTAGSPIRTTPASDGVGEWFFGADDGYVYELQQPPGQSTMVVVGRFGPVGGSVRSSVLVGGCTSGICIYLGSTNGNAYIVPLNARDVKLTACISNPPPACSGDNPRLWAQVTVGSAASPQTVRVQGWSYYSP